MKKCGTYFDASLESEDLCLFKLKFFESDIPILEKMVDSFIGKSIGNAFVGPFRVCLIILAFPRDWIVLTQKQSNP
ncbi:hypothetical protein H8356DRAFT_1353659 [Neocallimastix lanati (nom. inval.)]|nr:hypothetical protein H8356DRAFT_1353659 [Neocallimastix sp. JGI-2020a]